MKLMPSLEQPVLLPPWLLLYWRSSCKEAILIDFQTAFSSIQTILNHNNGTSKPPQTLDFMQKIIMNLRPETQPQLCIIRKKNINVNI